MNPLRSLFGAWLGGAAKLYIGARGSKHAGGRRGVGWQKKRAAKRARKANRKAARR